MLGREAGSRRCPEARCHRHRISSRPFVPPLPFPRLGTGESDGAPASARGFLRADGAAERTGRRGSRREAHRQAPRGGRLPEPQRQQGRPEFLAHGGVVDFRVLQPQQRQTNAEGVQQRGFGNPPPLHLLAHLGEQAGDGLVAGGSKHGEGRQGRNGSGRRRRMGRRRGNGRSRRTGRKKHGRQIRGGLTIGEILSASILANRWVLSRGYKGIRQQSARTEAARLGTMLPDFAVAAAVSRLGNTRLGTDFSQHFSPAATFKRVSSGRGLENPVPPLLRGVPVAQAAFPAPRPCLRPASRLACCGGGRVIREQCGKGEGLLLLFLYI